MKQLRTQLTKVWLRFFIGCYPYVLEGDSMNADLDAMYKTNWR